MRDFNLAMGLFERTAAQSQRAKVALVSLVSSGLCNFLIMNFV